MLPSPAKNGAGSPTLPMRCGRESPSARASMARLENPKLYTHTLHLGEMPWLHPRAAQQWRPCGWVQEGLNPKPYSLGSVLRRSRTRERLGAGGPPDVLLEDLNPKPYSLGSAERRGRTRERLRAGGPPDALQQGVSPPAGGTPRGPPQRRAAFPARRGRGHRGAGGDARRNGRPRRQAACA